MADFLKMIVRACQPDAPPGMAEQLHAATRGMAQQADLPPEVRELGRVLNGILAGDRAPDLSTLPPELAEVVREVCRGI